MSKHTDHITIGRNPELTYNVIQAVAKRETQRQRRRAFWANWSWERRPGKFLDGLGGVAFVYVVLLLTWALLVTFL